MAEQELSVSNFKVPEGYKLVRNDEYDSPFAKRYGSREMRVVWAERTRWLRGRDMWIANANTQSKVGLATPEQVSDLITHRDEIDIDVIDSREMNESDPRYVGHDVMAAISEYADKATIAAPIIHVPLTSDDLHGNVEPWQILESFKIIRKQVDDILLGLGETILKYKDLVCEGFTHDQAAEPTTVGYRLANTGYELLKSRRFLNFIKNEIEGKGIKGPVGTSAPTTDLLKGTGMSAKEYEDDVMEQFGLPAAPVSRQGYSKLYTVWTIFGLASVSAVAHKLARDSKALQSSPFNEWSEPRNPKDKGSSIMKHKRNPRHAEATKSLSRGVMTGTVEPLWMVAEETFERGIEDSASKRSYLPEAFLASNEILKRTLRLAKGLVVNEDSIRRNLERWGTFSGIEPVFIEAVKKGGDRQTIDDILTKLASESSDAVNRGEPNPLRDLVKNHPGISKLLSPEEIDERFDSIYQHIGNAPQSCEDFVEKMRKELSV